ncbi:MAG: diguanylate cyclase, partial [Oscillospiraceae bacterium]
MAMNSDWYKNILNSIKEGVYFVDPDRTILFWNKAAEELTGFTAEEVVGIHCQDNLLCHIDSDANPLCLAGCPVHATIHDGQVREAEVFLRHKEGFRIAVQVTSSPVYDGENLIGCVETFSRNTRRIYEDDLVNSLTQLVMTDRLTGLYNRRYAENNIKAKIQEVRHDGRNYGLLFVDLDNFSSYNNLYGHEAGDSVLRCVADTVQNNIREYDLFCRWGGEEFLGIFRLKFPGEIAQIGDKICRVIREMAIQIDGEEKHITA